MTIKAIVFDLDGTLVDAKDWHYEALNEALSLFGLQISRADHENRFDGLPTKKKLEVLSEEQGLPVSLFPIISAIKQDSTLKHISNKCFPRVEKLLMFQWIKSMGYSTSVATNSIRKTAEAMLSASGLLNHLDILLTNEDVKMAKPNPEIYLLAAARLGVLPEECLVVEDHDYGIRAAEEAGCRVLRVPNVESVDTSLIEAALRDLGHVK